MDAVRCLYCSDGGGCPVPFRFRFVSSSFQTEYTCARGAQAGNSSRLASALAAAGGGKQFTGSRVPPLKASPKPSIDNPNNSTPSTLKPKQADRGGGGGEALVASEGYRRPCTVPRFKGWRAHPKTMTLPRAINPNRGARADPAPPLAWDETRMGPPTMCRRTGQTAFHLLR